jgi:hypothetical protein
MGSASAVGMRVQEIITVPSAEASSTLSQQQDKLHNQQELKGQKNLDKAQIINHPMQHLFNL